MTSVDYLAIPDGHETEKHLEFWASQAERDDLDNAMLVVWDIGLWRQASEHMSDDEREAAADAILRAARGINDGELKVDPQQLRWWR